MTIFERWRDAADLAAMHHAAALTGHYGEAHYDHWPHHPRRAGDYFPPPPPATPVALAALFAFVVLSSFVGATLPIWRFIVHWLALDIWPAALGALVGGLFIISQMRFPFRLMRAPRINSVTDAVAFATRHFGKVGYHREHVGAIGLDHQRRAIFFYRDRGDRGLAYIGLRTLLDDAIASEAIALILFHNHPSGICSPSPQDLKTTTQIAELLHGVGINLLDHIILTQDAHYSFRQNGLL